MRYSIVAVAVLGNAFPAYGRPPPYAHRPGVTAEVRDADVVTCFNDAMKVMNDPSYKSPWVLNPASEQTTAGAMGAGLARGIMQGFEDGKRFKLTYFDCYRQRLHAAAPH